MLNETDTACVVITLALCLKNKKNRHWTKNGAKAYHNPPMEIS
jgi:hypothetical protein